MSRGRRSAAKLLTEEPETLSSAQQLDFEKTICLGETQKMSNHTEK